MDMDNEDKDDCSTPSNRVYSSKHSASTVGQTYNNLKASTSSSREQDSEMEGEEK